MVSFAILSNYKTAYLCMLNKMPFICFQNRGVYMFRVDPETVIDATLTGGPARYINHSCDVSSIV